MPNRTCAGILLVSMSTAIAGCDGADGRRRALGPTPVPGSDAPQLVSFMDPTTRATTTDVRDAQGHVVQFTSTGELVWTADGTRLKGYPVNGITIPAEPVCQCWLEVRFGTENGESRAYLTADYGHYNPGSLVNLDIVGGALVISQSDVYPPGTYTLSGVVTEVTATGIVPIEGAGVSRQNATGWQAATTDNSGFYKIQGLYDRTNTVWAGKEGYRSFEEQVAVHGDTQLDIQLARR